MTSINQLLPPDAPPTEAERFRAQTSIRASNLCVRILVWARLRPWQPVNRWRQRRTIVREAAAIERRMVAQRAWSFHREQRP